MSSCLSNCHSKLVQIGIKSLLCTLMYRTLPCRRVNLVHTNRAQPPDPEVFHFYRILPELLLSLLFLLHSGWNSQHSPANILQFRLLSGCWRCWLGKYNFLGAIQNETWCVYWIFTSLVLYNISMSQLGDIAFTFFELGRPG